MPDALQLFDALTPQDFAALKASIAAQGLLVPITTDQDGTILDGSHRARACEELGVAPRYEIVRCVDDTDRQIRALVMNLLRRQLTREQKARAVGQLRALGYTLSRIAQDTGLSYGTVHALKHEFITSDKLPERVTGKDGKSRPTKYKPRKPKPTTVIYAKTPQEATRVQKALVQLGADAPATVMDVKRVERVAREHAAATRRAHAIAPSTTQDAVTLVHGDFRLVLATLPDATVDAILTDPPYAREALPLLADLSRLAARLLTPAGILAVLSGQAFLPAVLEALNTAVTYRWMGAYLTAGPHTMVQAGRVATGWKPLLLYHRGAGEAAPFLLQDVFQGTGKEKTYHPWGQNLEGMLQIVERLTSPGALVVDPFVGGGTTALACRRLGRRFLGCDLDAAAVQTARERLHEHA